jgi:hypothetical protein
LTVLSALSLTAGCSDYSISKDPPGVDLVDTADTGVPTPPTPLPGEPDIELDRTDTNFGIFPATCPLVVPFTATNVGTGDLIISDVIVADGQAFSVQQGGVTLAPGESTLYSVEFTADAPGVVYDDQIDIWSNDPDEGISTVTLSGEGAPVGQIEELFDQVGSSTPIDILFVIDNSTSMQDENNALANNFNTFIQGFLALNLDYQIGVVTTDMQTPSDMGQLKGPIITTATPDPVAQFNQNVDVPFTDVMEEQGLDAAYTALTPPLINGVNAGLVRPGSLLSVIVISDEDDQSVVTANDMITLLDTYHGDPTLTSLSIVGGPKTGIWPCGGFLFGAGPVPTYWDVAQATGGIHLNLCQLDMNEIVSQLAVVAAGLSTEFFLNTVPSDPAAVEVIVDGTPVPNDPDNGWTYDAANNSIVFAGNGIPAGGAQIRVVIPDDSGACP